MIQTPTKTYSDPTLDTLSPAHHARIIKRREYVDRRLTETDFNAGRDRDTPEEKRTLKQITLSDRQGEVIFLPASSSSGNGISPDISALLRSLASIALQNDRVLDANPLPLFLRTAKKKISAALMKAMANHMMSIRENLKPSNPLLTHHSLCFSSSLNLNDISIPPSSFPHVLPPFSAVPPLTG